METFGLSNEDAQDRDYWRMRVKGEPANPDLPGKWPLKRCLCVCIFQVNLDCRLDSQLPIILSILLGETETLHTLLSEVGS